MKKFFFASMLFGAMISTANAQTATDTKAQAPQAGTDKVANMLAEAKKLIPEMVEKTGITAEQANKVIEINFETRMAAAGLTDLSEADRTAKITELKAARAKKISEVLSVEQIAAVDNFYKERGKAMQQKQQQQKSGN